MSENGQNLAISENFGQISDEMQESKFKYFTKNGPNSFFWAKFHQMLNISNNSSKIPQNMRYFG
jgi:hypothetical protein